MCLRGAGATPGMHTIILLTGDRLCVSELPVWRPAKPNSWLRIGQNIIIIFIYWVAPWLFVASKKY